MPDRQLSAAGNLTLTGTKYLWLRRQEDLCERAAAEFRSLLVQDLQAGTTLALKENFGHFGGLGDQIPVGLGGNGTGQSTHVAGQSR